MVTLKQTFLGLSLAAALSAPGLMLANNAANTNFKNIAYLTSWSSNTLDLTQLSKNVTELNLAFGNIDASSLKPVGSDGMLDPDSGKTWKQAAYNIWTTYKYNNPNSKILLAFGGATYSDLWTSTLTDSNAAAIAQNMADAMNAEYPVYQFDSQYVPHVIGNVNLDGVDLDVETGGGRLTDQQANNVITLIKALRAAMPNKIITLTEFSTAADPASCQTTPGPDCSFVGSAHSGEMTNVLTEAGQDLDWVNDMAYDAGPNYPYQISLNNIAKYIPQNKVVLGLDFEKQWGPKGDFIETLNELVNRATWSKSNNFGGNMVWALGASSGIPLDQQVESMNKIADIN